MNKDMLEMIATDVIERLLKVIDEQKQTIVRYEGAIEGIKIFLKELKTKIDEGTLHEQHNKPKRSPQQVSPSVETVVDGDNAISD